MLVSDYDQMDAIVNSDPSLTWVGWDVVQDKQTPNGFTHFNGVFKDGAWYIRKTFRLTESGWNIPEKLVTKNVQVV